MPATDTQLTATRLAYLATQRIGFAIAIAVIARCCSATCRGASSRRPWGAGRIARSTARRARTPSRRCLRRSWTTTSRAVSAESLLQLASTQGERNSCVDRQWHLLRHELWLAYFQ